MLTAQERDYAHGKRRPGHTPGRLAAEHIAEIDDSVHLLENKLSAFLLDTPQTALCIDILDIVGAYAKDLVRRYERNGPPAGLSRLQKLKVVLELAQEMPDNFKLLPLDEIRKVIATQEKKGVT